jgi:hypothetical protein
MWHLNVQVFSRLDDVQPILNRNLLPINFNLWH